MILFLSVVHLTSWLCHKRLKMHLSGARARRGRSLTSEDPEERSNKKNEEEEEEEEANARLLRAVYLGEDEQETFLIKERWRKERESTVIDN